MVESGGYLYMMGGREGGRVVARVDRYSVKIEVWGGASPLTTVRVGACSAVMGGEVWVLGGRGEEGVLASVEVYRNALFTLEEGGEEMESMAPMSEGREGAGCVSFCDRLYIFGGRGKGGAVLASAEVYSGGTWCALAPMVVPREGFRVAVAEDRVMVVGGRRGEQLLERVDVFCLLSHTWVEGADQLPAPRADFALVAVATCALLPATLDRLGCREDSVVVRAGRVATPLGEYWAEVAAAHEVVRGVVEEVEGRELAREGEG